MASQTSGSFIPRNTPGKPTSRVSSGRIVGVFGYVSYVVFFGALLLSLGMFGLSFYIQSNLVERQDRLVTIQQAIQDRDVASLIAFDSYLRSAEDVFAGSYSILPALTSFEEVIADPVVLDAMNLTHEAGEIELEISAIANSFDATMFQRETLTELSVLPPARVSDVLLVQDIQSTLDRFVDVDAGDDPVVVAAQMEQLLSSMEGNQFVTFSLRFDMTADDLPFSLDMYNVGNPNSENIPGFGTEQIDQTFSDDGDDFDNEEDPDDDFFEELAS